MAPNPFTHATYSGRETGVTSGALSPGHCLSPLPGLRMGPFRPRASSSGEVICYGAAGLPSSAARQPGGTQLPGRNRCHRRLIHSRRERHCKG